MLFITTQPDSDYYIWQLRVQVNNFKKFGCEDKCVVIFGFNPSLGVNPNARKFEDSTQAKVLYYPDLRDLSTKLYLPSIRPHLLKQLYRNDFEVIKDKNFLYLDCDTIMSDYPNFTKLNDERAIHVSDTSSQFSLNTIKENYGDLYEKMCKTVMISPTIVDRNEDSGGGLVYAFKYFNYLDYHFWDKVERDSALLYKMLLVTVKGMSELPMISANKWALLWNLWLIGYDTKVTNELSMCWATSPIEDWRNHKLYNNATIGDEQIDYLFKKSDFLDKSPFTEDFAYVSDKYCSFKYVEEIEGVKKTLKS